MEPIITISDTLVLTAIQSEDKANLIKYLNDPLIIEQTLMIPYPYTDADAMWFIQFNRELEEKHGFIVNYAIRHGDEGLIGVIGRTMHTLFGGSHKDEIGYWIARPFWNKGFATQAIRAFSDACFAATILSRLEAHVNADNFASQRVLEKAGFTREGYHRQYYIKPQDGIMRDAIGYAKIKGDI